ncbi:MAG: SpoIIE family protein phosphatase [bacterium]|nr:SpoIIE family protein phosphatase [bacterium]
MKYTHILILLFLILFPIAIFAMEPVIIDDTIKKISIGKNIEYLEDVEGTLTIEDISSTSDDKKLKWKKSEKDFLGFGLAASAYWIKFTVQNKSEKNMEWNLLQSYAPINHIILYRSMGKNKFQQIETGNKFKFSKRQVPYRAFVFPQKLSPKESSHYYMRYQSKGSLNIELHIFTPEEFYRMKDIEAIFLWLFYGILMVMFLYNLFIFLFTRDMSYFYYILFILTILIASMSLKGMADQYLWPGLASLNDYSIPFSIEIMVISLLQFKMNFTRARKHFRIVSIRCRVYTILAGIAAVLTPIINNYAITVKIVSFIALTSMIFSMIEIFYMAFIKKSRQARFLALAFGIFLVCSLIYLLTLLAAFETNIVFVHLLELGTVFFVVLLSLGLADRINAMRKKLLVLNLNLEDRVLARTEELLAANEEMEAINHDLIQTRDALWGEMQLAKKIQTVLLPEKPAMPGFNIAVYMNPADEVGGDYYDIIHFEGIDWLVIGDVSGHGVPAGLIMMMVQTSIHSVLNVIPDAKPSKILENVNHVISENIKRLDEDKYMTITVLACFDKVSFCFSGLHQDIMIYRNKTGTVELLETDGIWIGLFENLTRRQKDDKLVMHSEDVMLLYTDGITDAWKKGTVQDQRDPETEMFGKKQLEIILKNNGTGTTEEIKNILVDSLRDYDCMDDVTLVVVKKMK